jgi:hypothetical protein
MWCCCVVRRTRGRLSSTSEWGRINTRSRILRARAGSLRRREDGDGPRVSRCKLPWSGVDGQLARVHDGVALRGAEGNIRRRTVSTLLLLCMVDYCVADIHTVSKIRKWRRHSKAKQMHSCDESEFESKLFPSPHSVYMST